LGWIIVSKKQVHKSSGRIELLAIDKSSIKVAEYMTELPKRELLEHKLHKTVELARKRLEADPTERNTEYR
jgi:lipopolysaccharide biosynthesis regulator YciM